MWEDTMHEQVFVHQERAPSRPGRRWHRNAAKVALLSLIAFGLAGGVAQAQGGGGTAKPPKGAVSPFITPNLPDPAFSVNPALIHGFDVTGFIQDATASNAACPTVTDKARWGGTVTINNIQIAVPCNLVVQMPANTFTWGDFMDPARPSLTLKDTAFPSFELSVVGNIVDKKYVAGLAYASQESTNTGTGVITGFDFANGIMQLDNGNGGTTTVQINDPVVDGTGTGRYSAGKSPDERFSVDQANPTIHAATGYPMCIPRTAGNDPLCPQANRPVANAALQGCRNFSQSGLAVLPASGELSAPAAPGFCKQYVMPAAGTVGAPDPTQQAPFEIGDYVNYSGTLVHDSGTTQVNGGKDYISANTIEANLGIYTQPGTQPAYVAIGEFGIGTADPNATAVSGIAQETQDRIFLEAETTDIKTPVDIYLMDLNKDSGNVSNRWVTPFEMTGENQLGGPSGGITTQFTGAQPQRARLRATKSPTGLLSQPGRLIRVAQRTLKSTAGVSCIPTPISATSQVYDQAGLDACFNSLPLVANGLNSGQYFAPVFEYIFPENVKPGDALVPYDLWHLPALRNGEGASAAAGASLATPGVGPLTPAPW
jgi:hypothetical protein